MMPGIISAVRYGVNIGRGKEGLWNRFIESAKKKKKTEPTVALRSFSFIYTPPRVSSAESIPALPVV